MVRPRGSSARNGELGGLGVSREDVRMRSDDRKALARARAAQVMAKKYAARDRVKSQLLMDQQRCRSRQRTGRDQMIRKWKEKMQHSPFLVDLVADHERLDEENRIRLEAENTRARNREKQRLALQQQIIVRALREENDLEALRREKRAIVEEEKRLKALLDLEKIQSSRKVDLLAAERAERQRKAAKNELRRRRNLEAIQKNRATETDLLRATFDNSTPRTTAEQRTD